MLLLFFSHETFLSTLLQQVTLPYGEFTEWALSLSCLIYFRKSVN